MGCVYAWWGAGGRICVDTSFVVIDPEPGERDDHGWTTTTLGDAAEGTGTDQSVAT